MREVMNRHSPQMRKRHGDQDHRFSAHTFVLVLLTVSMLVPLGAQQPTSASHATPPYYFGTLNSDSTRAQSSLSTGIRTIEFVINWSSYEPQDGLFSQDYITGKQRELQAWLDAGIRPTLSLSLHYTPEWVCGLPGATFRDQFDATTCQPPNMVFSETVRAKIKRTIQHVAADFGPENFWAVRVQNGALQGEIGYPTAEGNRFWAYDANASGGLDLPRTIPPRPYPDWEPGDDSITTTQVREWFDWYMAALADAQDSQIAEYRRWGFAGPFWLIMPGACCHVNEVERYLDGHLGNANQFIGQGSARWYMVRALKEKANVGVYTSSLAEAGSARDSCQPGDASLSERDPVVDGFGAGRWTGFIAKEFGLLAAGENPDPSHSADYGVSMMDAAARIAHSCGYVAMYWAHEDELYSGGLLSYYASVIDQYHGD
jgi:hypothetical protein